MSNGRESPSTPHSAMTADEHLRWALAAIDLVRNALRSGGYEDDSTALHNLRTAEASVMEARQLAPVSETGRITELESKLAAMESALKGASNYIADSETHPQRIEFADGRVVAMKGQGYLYVSRKEAE